MLEFLKRFIAPASAGDDPNLSVQSQVQSLRLELSSREQALSRLKAELERERSTAQLHADEVARARLARLMQSAAAPAAQLALQAYLLEAEGKPVQARDVLAVARNLVAALDNEGLTHEEKPGERVAFDPNRHEPLGAGVTLSPGEPALVKLPGLSFQGALLRKAGVVPAPASS